MVSTMYPLSHPQKRVWVIENVFPGTPMYNIGGVTQFNSSIDLELLRESICQVVKDNESIRIQLCLQGDEVLQYVSNNVDCHIPFVDFSYKMEPISEFLAWCKQCFQKPFQLFNSPLIEFYIFRISSNVMGYYAKVHHIICDGWSMKLIAEQVIQNYLAKSEDKQVVAEEQSYLTYLQKEQTYLTSPRFQKDKAYWNEKFADLSKSALQMSSEQTNAARMTYMLSPERSYLIRRYTSDRSISLLAFFSGILFIYLSRIQRSEDVTIGTPVLNRSGAKEKKSLGMFTSNMPLRITVNEDNTVSNFMREVNKELLTCMFHQRYPYDKLVEDLQLKQQGMDQLFQHCINYSNASLPERCAEIQLETLDVFSGHQIYGLHVLVKDWFEDGSIRLDLEYKTQDYSSQQAEEIVNTFEYIIEQILTSDDVSLHQLEVIRPDYKLKILQDWNRTDAELPSSVNSVVSLFEHQVSLTPDVVALRFGNRSWTYNELNQKANNLARILQNKGIEAEDIVAIWATHSPETVVSIWAVLKVGGAFLPIDPEYPEERVQFMLEDSQAILTITNLDLHQITKCDVLCIAMDSLHSGEVQNLESSPSQNQLAYIIYTSGSTGNPKGVLIEHQGLLNYIWWAKETYVTGREVFPLYSSFAFDLTITSIFTPLISGNQIIVYETKTQPTFALEQVLKDNRATVVKLTPSHLRLIKEFDFQTSSIKKFIVGGEDLKVVLAEEIVHKFNGDVVIYNEYGPTETVVGCMIHKFAEGTYADASVNIGKPIQNMKIYVLDDKLRPLPIGIAGDIYVSGIGVARGYLNRKELTEERFVTNPFVQKARMYKTGDIGYYTSDGELHYMGRSDNQYKINGYRIELLEIEKAINTLEDVVDSIVITFKLESGVDLLAAYVQTKGDTSAKELKRSLARLVPSYMIPSQVMIVDNLPVTVNGKVDRNKLPKLDFMSSVNQEQPNNIESTVLSVVKDVLGIEQVSLTDNFFFIGGDSIKAIQIAARLQNYGLSLNVKEILLFPVIKEHAALAVSLLAMSTKSTPCEGEVLSTPISNWFFNNEFSNEHHYLQSVTLNLDSDITYMKFFAAAKRVIEKHDSLRLFFNEETQSLSYATYFPFENAISHYKVSSEESNYEDDICKKILDVKKTININEAPLVRFVFFESPQGNQAFLVSHHLLVDGVSWRIILDDFIQYFEADPKKQASQVYRVGNSYQEWAMALHTSLAEGRFDNEVAYWSKVVSNINYSNMISIKKIRDGGKPKINRISRYISPEQTDELERVANKAFDLKTFELIAAALVLTVRKYRHDSHISIMLEGHGRETFNNNIRIENTVGWFTSLYPVNLYIQENESLEMTVRSIRDQLRLTPQSGFGYGVLSYLGKKFAVDEKKLIRLNYLGELDAAIKENRFFSVSREHFESDVGEENGISCLIDVNVSILNKRLMIDILYDGQDFFDAQINSFLDQFYKNIEIILSIAVKVSGEEKSIFIPEGTVISFEDLSMLFNT